MAVLERDLKQNTNEIKQVDFNGDTLLAVQSNEDGKIYVAVKWVCEGLGLTKGQMQNERKRVQEDIVLSKGERNLDLPTGGGIQTIQAIDIEFLPLWLAKISITPNMQKENPNAVERLIKYQLEAKDVLEKAFIKKQLFIPENLSPELQMFGQMFQVVANIELGYTEMAEEVAIAKEEINTIKDTLVEDVEDWRVWTNEKLRFIGAALGDYRRPRIKSYEELERRARCNLDRRLENKIENMKKAGAGKKMINNTNKLDVIDEDPRLKEIYISIVKEMSIKYL